MHRNSRFIPPKSAENADAPFAAPTLTFGEAFFELIAARTGLAIRAKDRETVALALAARMSALDLNETATYLAMLSAADETSVAEWHALAPALTNGESYFWRDRGQFELLRRAILPALASERGLRIWSAGCSTGEEVYSLAMLCHELFPDARPRVQIVGTDLNEAALQRARRGCYGEWSFRGVEAARKARYFTRHSDGWHVKNELRALVSFRQLNLCAPAPKASAMRGFDLILCRNVLIYLAPAAIRQAVALFNDALCDGGFLMTGHAELANHDAGVLVPRSWPESLVYQKIAASRLPTPTPASPLRLPVPAPKIAPSPVVPARVPAAPPMPKAEPFNDTLADRLATAQAAADAGDYATATASCRAAIEANSFNADAYLLWARIEIERGEIAHAKVLLKKVVYLAPDQAAGFVELAALYEAGNDAARAERMRAIAERIEAS